MPGISGFQDHSKVSAVFFLRCLSMSVTVSGLFRNYYNESYTITFCIFLNEGCLEVLIASKASISTDPTIAPESLTLCTASFLWSGE